MPRYRSEHPRTVSEPLSAELLVGLGETGHLAHCEVPHATCIRRRETSARLRPGRTVLVVADSNSLEIPGTVARTAWLAGAARAGGLVVSLVAVSFLLRALGLVGYGHFVTWTSVLTVIAAASEFGLTALVSRDLPVATDKSHYLRTLWRTRWLSLLPVVALGAAGVALAVSGRVHVGVALMLVATLNVISQVVTQLVTVVGFALGRGAWVVSLELAGKILWVLGAMSLFYWGGTWVLALAIISVTAALPFVAYRWLIGDRRKAQNQTSVGRGDVRTMLKSSGVLAGFPIIYLAFNRADVLGLSLSARAAVVGRYATCYRLTDALLGVMVGAASALLPAMADKERRRERHERGRRRLLLGIGWVGAVGIAASPIWLRVLSGPTMTIGVSDVWVVALLAIGVGSYTGMQVDMAALVAERMHLRGSLIMILAAVVEGVGAYFASGSLLVVAGVVLGIEVLAVLLSSELCRRQGLVGGVANGKWLSGGWVPAGAGIVGAAVDTVTKSSVTGACVACLVVGVCAIVSPAVRSELLLVTSRLGTIGRRAETLLRMGLSKE